MLSFIYIKNKIVCLKTALGGGGEGGGGELLYFDELTGYFSFSGNNFSKLKLEIYVSSMPVIRVKPSVT